MLMEDRAHRDVIGAKGFQGKAEHAGKRRRIVDWPSRLEELSEDGGPDKKNQLMTLRKLGTMIFFDSLAPLSCL